ncbi:hypothetical protein BB560_000697 [Smittium megazygosporum]|uniref:Serine/threonine-protein phosphatase n=1 Tax=Smittium megazygosporum TaxID=133381 RepID=A0A2T9ZJL5_9FUNG|nr:hypothetical protein BB560_000697 [Smittium megazygosporum]
MTEIDKKAEAIKIKNEANKLFSEKKFKEAIEAYTKAIKLDSSVPAFYSNRAQCYIRTELYGAAIEDASEAIKLDNSFTKGYYRRAAALLAMGEIGKARNDFKIVVARMPNDKAVKDKLRTVTQMFKEMMFAEAISGQEDDRLVSSIIDLMDYPLENDYSGPRMKLREKSTEESSVNSETAKKDESSTGQRVENGVNTNDKENEILEYVDKEFVDSLTVWFKDQKKLPLRYMYAILILLQRYLRPLESLIDVKIEKDSILNICGDVHGQYYDLLNIFKLAGEPSKTNTFLFNGDFVDRGSFSIETVMLLFAYKLLYPDHFFLNRGNHESLNMNKIYGFEGEILAKYGKYHGPRLFDLFQETFNVLPVAHLVQEKIFVVHGGLYSEEMEAVDDTANIKGVTLDMIRKINRTKQPSDGGLLTELLWSDPQKMNGRAPNKRGVAIQFGPDITEKFLKLNNLSMIVRSHEQKDNGYEIDHDGKCVTVFSAPNYCDQMGNLGAFMKVSPSLEIEYKTFSAVPHPPVKSMAYASGSPFF